MTKEQLEKIQECLTEYSNCTHDSFGGITFHDCCCNRVIYENETMTEKGHADDCVTMECLKIVKEELAKLK